MGNGEVGEMPLNKHLRRPCSVVGTAGIRAAILPLLTILPHASRPLHMLFPLPEIPFVLSLLGYVSLLKGICLGKASLTRL